MGSREHGATALLNFTINIESKVLGKNKSKPEIYIERPIKSFKHIEPFNWGDELNQQNVLNVKKPKRT